MNTDSTRAAFRVSARESAGFTLIELLVTLTLVGLLALVAMPLAEVTAVRSKEAELRLSLRSIRVAIDAYKAASDAGEIPRETGESGYPPSLAVLATGVERRLRSGGAPVSAGSGPAAGASSPAPAKRLYFLRRLPRDPFADDDSVPDEKTWQLRSYRSAPDRPEAGDDVFDVSSRSRRVGMNGVPYNTW
jgi:general secretion pathway protein G